MKSTFHPSRRINNKRQLIFSGTLELIRLIVLRIEVVVKAEDIIQVSFWVSFRRSIAKEKTPERSKIFSCNTLMITQWVWFNDKLHLELSTPKLKIAKISGIIGHTSQAFSETESTNLWARNMKSMVIQGQKNPKPKHPSAKTPISATWKSTNSLKDTCRWMGTFNWTPNCKELNTHAK